jgi:hypothetical protein
LSAKYQRVEFREIAGSFSTSAELSLAFDVHSPAQWLVPIVPPSVFDCFDPSEVERIPRHLEFTHREVAKFGLSQELGLIILNKLKQPIATAPPFFRSLFREFLASGRQSQVSHSPLLRCTKPP